MFKQRVRKIGNSEGIILPKVIIEALGLKLGEDVKLEIVEDSLILKPIKKRYQLEDLVARMTLENQHPIVFDDSQLGEEDVVWEEVNDSKKNEQK